MKYSSIPVTCLLACIISLAANSQWSSNPSINSPVCNLPQQQQNITIIGDGSGCIFVAWSDRRNGVDDDVYAQHYNAAGIALWTSTGAPVCTRSAIQEVAAMIRDASGGIIVFFGDTRNPDGEPDLYAQRLNSAGAKQWSTNGVAICTAALNQELAGVIPDGSGGAIIAWTDRRFDGPYDVFAQRINGSGVVQWTTNGVGVCTEASGQEEGVMIPDGAGGFIIAWADDRAGSDNRDIYAQRVNSSGAKQWSTGGIAVCNVPGDQIYPAIVSDNAGGALIAWTDMRSGSSSDIYAQRINSSGTKLWASTGLAVATGPQNQPLRSFDTDGNGGMMMAWDTSRVNVNDADVYAQRITRDGELLWGPDGSLITSAPNRQIIPSISHMSDGGAIISWDDERGPPSAGWSEAVDIYAQRVNGAGVIQWATNGIVVSNAPAPQSNSKAFTLPNNDAVILWMDNRNVFVTDIDIYMQNVHPDGTLGPGSIPVTCCPHGNLSMTAETTGSSYQWQVDTGSGFVNLSSDGTHSGVNTATLSMSNLPTEAYGYAYRCLVDGLAGSQFRPRPTETWTGSSNHDWHNPGNWSCGVVPDANTEVVISAGTTVINSNTTCRSLKLGPGVNFTVAQGVTVTVIQQ